MEHPGFFDRAGPFSLQQVAELSGAVLPPSADAQLLVSDVRPLDAAQESHISFFDNPKYLAQFTGTRAAACFVSPKFAARLPVHTAGLVTEQPYRCFAQALSLFYPDAGQPKAAPAQTGELVHPSAQIEAGVRIEPGAVIGPQAAIGRGTVVAAGAVVGYRVAVGRGCFIGPRVSLAHALIGNRVIIHAGACIGQDGFGFAMGRNGHLKVPQIGRVIIQDDVEIGANSCIDRGALRDTIIGEGTKIDNLVQIAHNVVIGRHCVIVAQCGIAGSTELEDFVVMGGQSGVVGHARIGAGAQIAAHSGVTANVPPGERWGGAPAKPIMHFAREVVLLKRLTSIFGGKDLKNLKRIAE